MSNQTMDNNLVNNINPLSGEEKSEKDNAQQHQNLSNKQNISNNSEANQKDNSPEQNLQNHFTNNSSNEDIIQNINSFLQQNKFTELSSYLNSNKNIIPQNILSSYISYILESYNGDPNILNIFLSNGANVNTVIHSSNCKIEEKDQINLLMFSIITNNMELFKLVIKYNPDVLLEAKNKKNSLVYSIFFNDDNNPLMLQELLKLNNKAVETIYYDPDTNTTHNLLTLAASKNKKNIVALLLDYNCNINYQIPQTGETAMHLTVKNDNVEIAEIINKNLKYIKNIKNNLGETPNDISNKKKGKIFYQIITKEEQKNHGNNNSNNNLPKINNYSVQLKNEYNNMNNFNNNQNNQNLVNMQDFNNNNVGTNNHKKKHDKKDKLTNNNDLYSNNNEYIYYENNNQDNLIIPIEFQSVDYPTYLSMGQDIKLCLNLFQSEDSLTQQIEELEKQLKEKEDNIKQY